MKSNKNLNVLQKHKILKTQKVKNIYSLVLSENSLDIIISIVPMGHTEKMYEKFMGLVALVHVGTHFHRNSFKIVFQAASHFFDYVNVRRLR